MNAICAVCLVAWLVCGCAWTPERDNRVDPLSSFYEAPPPRNVPPQIDTLWMIREYRNHDFIPFSAFEVICLVVDSDNNLLLDSVVASVDTVLLGVMAYDPVRREYRIRRTQDDFPGDSLPGFFINQWIEVTAKDDSGAVGRARTRFRELVGDPPAVRRPLSWVMTPQHPWLVWYHYASGHPADDSISVEVLFEGVDVVWDSAGLPILQDSVQVTAELRTDVDAWYAWRVTVTKGIGDRLTSTPGYFQVLETDTLTDETHSRF